jgi:delta-aminolevulinic acid dehydratase/porphobilinogen synthase
MNTITIEIKATEIVEALKLLAEAFTGVMAPKETPKKTKITKTVEQVTPVEEIEQPVLIEESTTIEDVVEEIPPVQTYTLEEVREALANLTKRGKPIKDLITSFGVTKLTEIDPSKYNEVMQKAGEL